MLGMVRMAAVIYWIEVALQCQEQDSSGPEIIIWIGPRFILFILYLKSNLDVGTAVLFGSCRMFDSIRALLSTSKNRCSYT